MRSKVRQYDKPSLSNKILTGGCISISEKLLVITKSNFLYRKITSRLANRDRQLKLSRIRCALPHARGLYTAASRWYSDRPTSPHLWSGWLHIEGWLRNKERTPMGRCRRTVAHISIARVNFFSFSYCFPPWSFLIDKITALYQCIQYILTLYQIIVDLWYTVSAS